MNSLILTLDAGAGCCLPIAYQQLTQGALYAAWRGSYPQLHDEGFAGDGQTFRLFTFGPLEGRYRVQGNEITFTGLVQLEVRSPVEDLLYALGKSLTGAGALRLGRCVLPLRDLRSEDHYWFAAPLPVQPAASDAPATMMAEATMFGGTASIFGGDAAPLTVTLTDLADLAHTVTFPLDGTVSLGRDPGLCRIVLDYDPSISRHQCDLCLRGGDVVLVNRSSSNGTKVNGEKITTECPLTDGSIIKMGNAQLRLTIT